MLNPCVRIASDPKKMIERHLKKVKVGHYYYYYYYYYYFYYYCFYCSLPSAWKWGLCPIWVPGLCFRVCFGYALGMLSCVDTLIHFVGKGHSPFHSPEAYPLIISRSGPRKHSMLSWRSVGYLFSCNPYVCSIDRVFC